MLEHSPAISHSHPAERFGSYGLNTHTPPATRPTGGNSSDATKTAHLCCPANRYLLREPSAPSTNGTPQYAQIRFIDAFSFPHSSQTTAPPAREKPPRRSSSPSPRMLRGPVPERPHVDPVGRRPAAL